MTNKAKFILVFIAAWVSFWGVSTWVHKLHIPKWKLVRDEPSTNSTILESETHTVYWIGGEVQTNYVEHHRAAITNGMINQGFMDNGQVIWRAVK